MISQEAWEDGISMQDREERGGVERDRTRGEEEGVACWPCQRSIEVVQ